MVDELKTHLEQFDVAHDLGLCGDTRQQDQVAIRQAVHRHGVEVAQIHDTVEVLEQENHGEDERHLNANYSAGKDKIIVTDYHLETSLLVLKNSCVLIAHFKVKPRTTQTLHFSIHLMLSFYYTHYFHLIFDNNNVKICCYLLC